MSVTLRPITPDDEAFLYRVYASTRADEMAMVPWTDEQKYAFVRMQFRAQSVYYADQYAEAAFDIIERDSVPIGRLYLDRGDDDLCIIDITLIPEARGAGLGTQLLREILAEGERTRKSVSIHVEHFNPALRLYQRLGFEHVSDNGIYYLMRWSPGQAPRD